MARVTVTCLLTDPQRHTAAGYERWQVIRP
jgi:hypothetical protein